MSFLWSLLSYFGNEIDLLNVEEHSRNPKKKGKFNLRNAEKKVWSLGSNTMFSAEGNFAVQETLTLCRDCSGFFWDKIFLCCLSQPWTPGLKHSNYHCPSLEMFSHCYIWRKERHYWCAVVQGLDATWHPAVHRTAPHNKTTLPREPVILRLRNSGQTKHGREAFESCLYDIFTLFYLPLCKQM